MRKKDFKGCDASGKITGEARTRAEFLAFVEFLGDKSEEAASRRERAYRLLSADGEPSIPAKMEFVRRVAKRYVESALVRANTAAIERDASGDEPSREEAKEAATEVARDMRKLFGAVKGEVFDGVLLSARMNEPALKAFKKAILDPSFETGLVEKIIAAEAKEMSAAMREWAQSPEGRRKIVSASKKSSDKYDETMGFYAPLIRFITEEVAPAQKAEFIARFQDYVDSGLLAADMSSPKTAAAKKFSELGHAALKGGKVDSEAMAQALFGRLAEVSVGLKVEGIAEAREGKSRRAAGRGQISRNVAREQALTGEDIRSLQAQGIVDSIVAHKGKLYVSFATSVPRMNTQNLQWMRHLEGIQEWAARQTPPMKVERVRVFAPSMVEDASEKRGPRAGGEFEKLIGQKLTVRQTEALNAMPFATELLSGYGVGRSPEEWAKLVGDVDVSVAGSKSVGWGSLRKMGAFKRGSDPAAFALGRMADLAVELAKIAAASETKLTGFMEVDRAQGMSESMASFLDLAGKRCVGGADPKAKKALETIEANASVFAAAAENCAPNSPIRDALERLAAGSLSSRLEATKRELEEARRQLEEERAKAKGKAPAAKKMSAVVRSASAKVSKGQEEKPKPKAKASPGRK